MYDSKKYKISEDLEVIKIIDEDELSVYTVATYHSLLKQFTNCIGKTYSEIVHDVKAQERDKIINGTDIIRYNPNDGLINDYIQKYINYLTKLGNKKSSINIKTKQLLTLLKKSNIETPKIQFKNEAKQKRVQIIPTNDLRFILLNSSIHHKALFTFMASTGCRRYDVINNFTIDDYIEGCSDYVKSIFLDDFLEEAPQDMIPYFEFIPNKTKKTGLPCKVCCSAESSNYILQSLKARKKSIEKHNKIHHDNLELTEDCPLFSSKQKNYIGKFRDTSITGLFHYKNKLLRQEKEQQLKNQLQNREISKKEWKIKKDNIPIFHPHSLRHRFISILRAYTTNRDISLLMEGHASSISTDKYYVGENEELFNKETIKKTYLQIMPHLTFFQQVDPVSYLQKKSENDELREEIKKLKNRVNEYAKINEYLENNSVSNKLNKV